jgi:hypothetical protein
MMTLTLSSFFKAVFLLFMPGLHKARRPMPAVTSFELALKTYALTLN